MKKNIVRLMILGVLILLCIWQTVTLWLGDMSGHNFFVDNVTNYEASYVHPKQIWTNINGNIYKIESSSEKEDMLGELVLELQKDNLTVDMTPNESYDQLLFSTKGIVYEFGTDLTIDEIIGQPLKTRNSKYNSTKIKEIYVDFSQIDTYKAYVYLVDKEAHVKQKITLNSQLKSENGVVMLYSQQENVSGRKMYQASISNTNDSDFFVGNAFYPKLNSENPVMGNLFKLEPIIDDLEGKELENYVNDLFKNPTYKNMSMVEGGIAYSDNLNISVKYNLVGTLEFKKTLLGDTVKITDEERMSKINMFINDSQAIPTYLKKGIFLQDISIDEVTKETSYKFGYQYNNNEVILSQKAQEALGIDCFLELSIKNSEVTGGKWIMLQPVATDESREIETESNEAIEAIYENSGVLQDQLFTLDSLECAYIVKDINKIVDFEWIGFYMKQPILSDEKIDNE